MFNTSACTVQAKLAKLRRELLEPSTGAGAGGGGKGEGMHPPCLALILVLHVTACTGCNRSMSCSTHYSMCMAVNVLNVLRACTLQREQ